MKLRERIREIEYEYTVDQRELGKVLLVVSTTVFLISLTSLYQTRSTVQHVEETRSDLSQLDAVVNSQRFNQSLSTIQNLQGTTEGQKYQYAAQTFRGMQHSIDEVDKAEKDLEGMQNMYQWMVLSSILGATAGLTVIFL